MDSKVWRRKKTCFNNLILREEAFMSLFFLFIIYLAVSVQLRESVMSPDPMKFVFSITKSG